MQWESVKDWEQKNEPEIRIDWRKEMENSSDRYEVERFVRESLHTGMKYLRDTVGADYPFSSLFPVDITKRKNHAAQGSAMNLSVDALREAMTRHEQRDLHQSLIIHELVHGLVDEELLPMMIELAYIMENGKGTDRLHNLATLHATGRLPHKYFLSLQQIAHLLDMHSVNDFFSSAGDAMLALRLKNIFSQRIRKEFRKD